MSMHTKPAISSDATYASAAHPKSGLDFTTDGFPFLQGPAGTVYGRPFSVTVTLTSAAAATAVSAIADSLIPSGQKVYVSGFFAKVSGGTNWATTATIKIQDTNGTPVDFITTTINAATTNGNVVSYPGSNSNVALENAFILGTGGTAGKGLQVKGDANGTGSDYVVTIHGWIK